MWEDSAETQGHKKISCTEMCVCVHLCLTQSCLTEHTVKQKCTDLNYYYCTEHLDTRTKDLLGGIKISTFFDNIANSPLS